MGENTAGRDGDLLELLGADRQDVAGIISTLQRRGLTVATAESLTSGLLAAALTEIPGASTVVRGGLVCYATDLKAGLAGVDAALLDAVGPVHPDVARQLAAGARRVCGADIGVGLTGVAGPGPQDGHPAGTVYLGVATATRTDATRLTLGGVEPTRHAVRAAAVRAALRLLADEISGNGDR